MSCIMGNLGGFELGIGLLRQVVLPIQGLAMGCQDGLQDEGGMGDVAL